MTVASRLQYVPADSRNHECKCMLTYMHSMPGLYGVQIRWVCWSTKHSDATVIQPAFDSLGSVGKEEDDISISTKHVCSSK